MLKIAVPVEGTIIQNYCDALECVGLEPVAVNEICAANDFAGLLLPGGADVCPDRYGEAVNGAEETNPALDTLQFGMLAAFTALKKPVLGICRGHQVINVFFGGSLYQDLPTAARHRHIGHDQAHPTAAEEGSWIARLYGKTHITTNSAHHEGVKTPGRGLVVVQRAMDDGVVEGMIHEALPLISVQWHPERMCLSKAREDTVNGLPVFEHFRRMAEGK